MPDDENDVGLVLLPEAAKRMREDHGPEHERHVMWSAMADWLDTAGADLWAHGPLCCADGCFECDDNLWAPHVRRALAVSRAYLAATHVSPPVDGGSHE